MARERDRKPVAMSARFKTATGRQNVKITDLSITGCRLKTVYMALVVGQRLVLLPEGLEGLAATVSWSSGSEAGVKFEHPLHPSVFEHLCNTHADESRLIAMDLAA